MLASDAVYRDAVYETSSRPGGRWSWPRRTRRSALETGCLAVDARVARLGYGDGTRSYFDRLTLSLAARQVDEVVMPMDA